MRLLSEPAFDLGARNSTGSIDISRMRQGGLDALFFSIYMPGDVTGPLAVKRALLNRQGAGGCPRPPARADAGHVRGGYQARGGGTQDRRAHGMEGGHMIDAGLGVLRMYADLGVRYLTLTHIGNTTWADSSGDSRRTTVSRVGKDVVRELKASRNGGYLARLGQDFRRAIEVTKAPMMASHSSCRAISNGPRNMTDAMIKALAKNGGVIQIN